MAAAHLKAVRLTRGLRYVWAGGMAISYNSGESIGLPVHSADELIGNGGAVPVTPVEDKK